MTCALILAGGMGTRFWPKSTSKMPKQFLNLISDKSMLQLTVDRIKKYVDSDRIFIVVSDEHKDLVIKQTGLNDRNIIIQPDVRNTAPCVLWAINYINSIYENSNVIILPSDHLVLKEEEFINNIDKAINYVNNDIKAIVTLGIKPTRPETGFGYIEITNDEDLSKAKQFVEKPDLETAMSYIKTNKYLWNAGIFVFNIKNMIEVYKNNLKDMYNLLQDGNAGNYSLCDSISFDKAIMEHYTNIYVIPSDIGWDDIGTWASLERYIEKNENNNIFKGDIDFIDSCNNIVYANGKKIVLLDVNDIFVVDSDDAIIITNKKHINEVCDLRK